MSKNLIFLSQLKKFMNEDSSYTSQDENLLDAIEMTSLLFERITGREFDKKQRTEYYDSVENFKEVYNFTNYSSANIPLSYSTATYFTDKPYEIRLKHWPVDSVATFQLYYDPYKKFATVMDPTLYTVDYETGVITINAATYAAKKGIKVVYTAGYADSVDVGVTENLLNPAQERSLGLNIPTDLKIAALHQAAYYAAYNQASLCSTDAPKSNMYSSSKPFGDLNKNSMLLLDKYKRRYIRFV